MVTSQKLFMNVQLLPCWHGHAPMCTATGHIFTDQNVFLGCTSADQIRSDRVTSLLFIVSVGQERLGR